MRRSIAILSVVLAGCQTTQRPPVQTVFVPTPVACVDAAAIPPEPPQVGDRFNGDAKHDLQVLAPNAQALRKWGRDLRALIANCGVSVAQ